MSSKRWTEADRQRAAAEFERTGAEAEIKDYYGYLRQRAAEKSLLARVLSRAGDEISADEKERWLKFDELEQNNLRVTINLLISELESEPYVDSSKKLSIVRIIWSIIQIELHDASNAITIERKSSEHDYKSKVTRAGRNEIGRTGKSQMLITKKIVEEYIRKNPDASVSKIAKDILEPLNLELKTSDVSTMKLGRKLRGLISGILKNAEPNGRRKFQKRN